MEGEYSMEKKREINGKVIVKVMAKILLYVIVIGMMLLVLGLYAYEKEKEALGKELDILSIKLVNTDKDAQKEVLKNEEIELRDKGYNIKGINLSSEIDEETQKFKGLKLTLDYTPKYTGIVVKDKTIKVVYEKTKE